MLISSWPILSSAGHLSPLVKRPTACWLKCAATHVVIAVAPRSNSAADFSTLVDRPGTSTPDHLEGNLPEHTSALEHPNILHGAGFAQAQLALRAAEMRLPVGTRLNLVANCSDGNTAWGSHLNVMLTRSCFDDLLYRKPHQAGFFATHLVTSVPYTGQGMVGAAQRKTRLLVPTEPAGRLVRDSSPISRRCSIGR